MKKYILFFISIGLLLGTVLFYNVFNIEKNREVTFSESGYILNNLSDRFYFYQDEKYTKSYDNQIVFFDTEGSKVTVGKDNFIHYESGNIVALQESVLLDLERIEEDPIIYYNIGANKEIKKLSNRYTIKNLDTELQLQNAIWKISQNKYIILGDKITIKLNNGTEKEIQGYVEIEYSDNEIVSIYNQELSYQTISSDSFIELPNDIKINLGTKIVSKKDENKMSLEDMVINSDDNVTLIDLNTKTEGEEENKTDEENDTENQTVGGSTSTNTNITNNSSTNNSNSQSSIINQGTNSGNNGSESDKDDNKEESNIIEIETPEIKYEEMQEGETGVDITKVTVEPKFKFENMKVTSVGITGDIKITDKDNLLDKEGLININIINNDTGKNSYHTTEEYGKLSIPIDVQTLSPNTSYTIISSASYVVGEKTYTKNFLYKTFVTPKVGISIEKNGFTNESLGFEIDFKDELVNEVKVMLLDEKGGEFTKPIIQNYDNQTEYIEFTGLDPNTKYSLKVYEIKYEGVIRNGWEIYYDDFHTLKQKVEFEKVIYSIDTKNAKFNMYIEDIKDEDESIINYTYVMYKAEIQTDEQGNNKIIREEEPIYTKETQNKEISVNVGKVENGDKIVRNQFYVFQVIANCFDNEKYVEVGSNIEGPFILEGRSFPTVRFEKTEITSNKIIGNLKIFDTESTIKVDRNSKLRIVYSDSIEPDIIYKEIIDEIDRDEEGIFNIHIALENLRANHSYTFYVYGVVDLDNGNEPYKDVVIGSAIVTTKPYETLQGNFKSLNSSDTKFAVEFSLKREERVKESLSNLDSITFLIQSGSSFDDKQEYNSITITNSTAASYAKDNPNVQNLEDLLCDNKLIIVPTTFPGMEESDYSKLQYTILASMTIDGTKYDNKIPIVKLEENETIDGITFTKNKEKYSAIGITVNLTEKPIINPNTENAITIDDIVNKTAQNNYKELYDENLYDNTIVGYKLNAKISKDPNKIRVTSVSYYVWDKDMNPVTDEYGNQIVRTIGDKDSEEELTDYELVIGVNRGTNSSIDEDNRSGKLKRGCAYRFTYTFTYTDLETGIAGIWPSETEDSIKALKSKIKLPVKQLPNMVIYPYTSDDDSMKYQYRCFDYDFALKQIESDENQEEQYTEVECYSESGRYAGKASIIVNSNGYNYLTIDQGLNKDTIYELESEYKTNKTDTATTTIKWCKQKFEGVIEKENLNIKYEVSYDIKNNPNKIIIKLIEVDNFISRIAGAKVYFGGEALGKIYDIKNKNNEYFVEVDLLEVVDVESLIGKKFNVKVELYMDNGVTGFNSESIDDYKAYAILNDSGDYAYLNTDINNNETVFKLKTKALAKEKIFTENRLSFNENNKDISLVVKNIVLNEQTLQLNPTNSGLNSGQYIVIPKSIKAMEIDCRGTGNVEIDNVIHGIKINSSEPELTKVKINAELVNAEGLEDRIMGNKLVIELCEVSRSDEAPDWNGNSVQKIEVDLNQYMDPSTYNINYTIEGLNPGNYYKLRFKYMDSAYNTYVYMYNPEYTGGEFIYEIQTIANIGIKQDSITVSKDFISYYDKKIKISYEIDPLMSTKYYATRYEFYEFDENGTNNLGKMIYSTNNIENNGPEGESKREYSVVVEPNSNPFTFGKKYRLAIIPVVKNEITNEEKDIESSLFTWNTDKLKEPTKAIRMIRSEKEEEKTINVNVTFKDDDHLVFEDKYTLNIYENDEVIGSFEISTGEVNPLVVLGKESERWIDIEVDYSKTYRAEIAYRINMENKPGGERDKVFTETLNPTKGKTEIGNINKSITGDGEIRIDFYDSYNLGDGVDYIEYTIIELDTRIKVDSSMGEGTGKNIEFQTDGESGIIYLILPTKIPNYDPKYGYEVQLNFYYIKENGEKELIKQVAK